MRALLREPRAILADAGMTFANVMRFSAYVTDQALSQSGKIEETNPCRRQRLCLHRW